MLKSLSPNQAPLELADPALIEMRVGGYVAADPEAFIELLSSRMGLEARRTGDRHAVLSRSSRP